MRTTFAILLVMFLMGNVSAQEKINPAPVSFLMGVIDKGDSYLKEQGYEKPGYHKFGWEEEKCFKLNGIVFFQSDSVMLSFRKNNFERWNEFALQVEKYSTVQEDIVFYTFSNGSRGRMLTDGERWKFFLYTETGTFYYSGLVF